jgi:integrase
MWPDVATAPGFATWHREAGTPTHELQRLGGWKTPAMVERYAHVAPDGLQTAAVRLDKLLGLPGRGARESVTQTR